VGHVQWLNSQIPMRIPLLLQPQERAQTVGLGLAWP